MYYRMLVRHLGSDAEPWAEYYDHPTILNLEMALAKAQQTVENFNATLKPSEKARELVGVDTKPKPDTIQPIASPHTWEKVNLVTIVKGNQIYDIYKCTVCSITAKRYGVGGRIDRDDDYYAKGYESCAQSLILLTRRREMQKLREARANTVVKLPIRE